MIGKTTPTIREITVISGKGGTGKTTLAAAFATLAHPDAVLADCDVDAADLHLILEPKIFERKDFHGLNVAEIDAEKCILCGKCAEACRFDAIIPCNGEEIGEGIDGVAIGDDTGDNARDNGHSISQDGMEIIRERCEGCGVCELVCPVDAVSLVDRVDGELYTSETRFGPMAHARLQAGGEASGKLVAEVRSKARLLAQEHGKELIISDGPPGIGCPVISAISGTDLAVVVTEPTVSGISDMERVLEVAAHFKVKSGVIVNKSDVNPGKTEDIRTFCGAHDIPVFGELPYDILVTEAMVAEQSIVEFSDGEFAATVREIWRAIHENVSSS